MDIDILITGVGSVAATYALTRYLQYKRPELIIQAGVAGSFDPALASGSVVVVHKELLGDLGADEKTGFKSVFDLGLAQLNETPFKKGWMTNPYTTMLKRSRLKKVNAITVNEITTSKKRIAHYVDTYGASVESMEGAALHYVCLLENLPFMQIRGISNRVGDRNKKNWNLELAIEQVNQHLVRLLESL